MTGVIVARMQTPYLHDGYKDLISYIAKRVNHIVIVLGVSQALFTDKNPLPYAIRKQMIKDNYPFMRFEELQDVNCDKQWSKNLDDLLKKYEKPILYGSRDSFINQYSGNIITEVVDCKSNMSSSDIRKNISELSEDRINKDMRIGIIYGIEKRFPIVYPTVDIALVQGNDL